MIMREQVARALFDEDWIGEEGKNNPSCDADYAWKAAVKFGDDRYWLALADAAILAMRKSLNVGIQIKNVDYYNSRYPFNYKYS